uniref:Uncharacterized protein n=1 Tax=Alexandrium monilatum TaxID=311494 RepID=A0A7S4VJX7_9DINO
MGHYRCCYSSGRQFIFTERSRWALAALTVVAFCGLLLGLFIGVTISFAGFFPFELVMVAAAMHIAYHAYLLTFQRASSSDDVGGFCLFVLMLVSIVGLLLVTGWWSLIVDLDTVNRCALFSVLFTVLSMLVYGYVLCLQEDERKHHLDLCTADGDVFERAEKIDEGTVDDDNWAALVLFLNWIASWRWWSDCQASLDAPDDEELTSTPVDDDSQLRDIITVHNRTLKLIKVCFYSPEDMFCFVPFGGVSGDCVGLIQAEECRSFRMPRRIGAAPAAWYTLKVFQPAVFDRELARYARARHGHHLAFFDVEGTVKRSRLLSAGRAAVEPKAPIPFSDTSDDELAGRHRPHSLGSSGGLKRNSSSSSSALLCNVRCLEDSLALRRCSGSPTQTGSPTQGGSPTEISEARKAGLDEVVVRNRSNQEIRALLFRSNDYCYMVPLVGKLLTCGDCILPSSERRFTPHIADKDFTLKVYSTGAGARELTYLTVYRGHTYTFCDSLLT